jgi:hypothetical protein
MIAASLGVFGYAAGAVVLSWAYFRRCRMTRPPLGVFNLADVLIMLVAVVLVPYLYVALPTWLVGALLGGLTVGILYVTLEPFPVPRRAIWLGILVLVAADLGSWLRFGATCTAFAATNDVVLTVAAVGVANLWAQSGMKARDAALLGGMLAAYDFIFTARLPLMNDLLGRLAGLPFAPQVAWPVGEGQWVGIGLGDLLLASAFPLVMRKAFGLVAGLLALSTALGVIGALLGLAGLGALGEAFPLMVVLGPLMVLEYAYWIRRGRQERTTREYLRAEPLPRG